jgi:hypothetical protein
MFLWGDFCGDILHGVASLKTSPLRGKECGPDWNNVCRCYKGANALGFVALYIKFCQVVYVPRMLEVFARLCCDPVAIWDVFFLMMKVPSHFGSSLPRNSVLLVLIRMRSRSSNSLRLILLSRHAFVCTWYLFNVSTERTRSPSRRYLVFDSSTSGVVVAFVRGDPCFISCGVMASDPYIKRKGVNQVALDSIVFSAQMTLGSW